MPGADNIIRLSDVRAARAVPADEPPALADAEEPIGSQDPFSDAERYFLGALNGIDEAMDNLTRLARRGCRSDDDRAKVARIVSTAADVIMFLATPADFCEDLEVDGDVVDFDEGRLVALKRRFCDAESDADREQAFNALIERLGWLLLHDLASWADLAVKNERHQRRVDDIVNDLRSRLDRLELPAE